MKNKLNYACLLLLILSNSCIKDTWTKQEDFSFEHEGVYIVNSGNFGSSTSSLSYYDIKNKTVYNNIISRTNPIEYWGDVAQSMTIHHGIAYIVINNSGKVLLVNSNTSKIVGKISNLHSPRHLLFINDNKAYITDLYARAISIVNPAAMHTSDTANALTQESSSIHIGKISTNNHQDFLQHSTEKLIKWGNKVFVACWMRDNKVLVIDSHQDRITDSITVAAQPNSLVIDKFNKLWVLCDGGYEDNPYAFENPKLYRINAQNHTIEDSVTFQLKDNPQELQINGTNDTLYFLNTHVFKMPITTLKPELFIESHSEHIGYGRGFYGLAIHPFNSEVYISDAVDNSQPGYVYRFSARGESIDTFKVGVNPISFCFK